MTFRCAVTNEVSLPNEKAVNLVVEKRFKQYKNVEGEVICEGYETVREVKIRLRNLDKAKTKYGLSDV
jgi:uncharacterized protein YggE